LLYHLEKKYLDDFADSVFLNCMTNKTPWHISNFTGWFVEGEKVVDLAAELNKG
jgi:hypothetical protein